jgi:hypothetical protein
VLAGGIPALIVNMEPMGRTIIEGFRGGYHFKQRDEGRYELDPEKNWYSHTMNCVEYLATRLDAQPPARGDDGDNGREPWRSIASSTSRG